MGNRAGKAKKGASKYADPPSANKYAQEDPYADDGDTEAVPGGNETKREYGNLEDFERDYSRGVGTKARKRKEPEKKLDPQLQSFAESLKKKQNASHASAAGRRTPGKHNHIMMGGVQQLPGTLRSRTVSRDEEDEPGVEDAVSTTETLTGVAAALQQPAAGGYGFGSVAHRRPR